MAAMEPNWRRPDPSAPQGPTDRPGVRTVPRDRRVPQADWGAACPTRYRRSPRRPFDGQLGARLPDTARYREPGQGYYGNLAPPLVRYRRERLARGRPHHVAHHPRRLAGVRSRRTPSRVNALSGIGPTILSATMTKTRPPRRCRCRVRTDSRRPIFTASSVWSSVIIHSATFRCSPAPALCNTSS